MIQSALALALLALLATECHGAAACTSTKSKIVDGRTEYILYSHEEYAEGSKHPNNVSCTWNIDAPPGGSTWVVKFQEIDIESSSTAQTCRFDNLTVVYDLSGQSLSSVFCGRHRGLTLLTNSSFRLTFKSDASVSYRGFNISWRSVSFREAAALLPLMSPVFRAKGSAGACSSLQSNGPPATFGGRRYNVTSIGMSMADGSYVHNAACNWIIPTSVSTAVYMTFESIQLEGGPPCSADNITVTYQLNRRTQTQRRVFCNISPRLTLVSRGMVTVQLRTDRTYGNRFRIKWFVAPYTGLSSMFQTSQEFKEEQCPGILQWRQDPIIPMYYEPPLTYESNMRCTWRLSVSPGRIADFFFTKFQLSRDRYRQPWRLYNSTRLRDYCSSREDSVTIMYTEMGPFGKRTKTFCNSTNVQPHQLVLSATGQVTITFRSNGYGNSQGFVLVYKTRDQELTPSTACPSVAQLDRYRQQITNASLLYGVPTCSWNLESPGENYLMSLVVTLSPSIVTYGSSYYGAYSFRYQERTRMCDNMVTVTSQDSISGDVLLLAGDRDLSRISTRPFRREYCPVVMKMPVGLFAGAVNISISTRGSVLDLRGFTLSVIRIPRPQRGCSTVTVSTEHRKSQIIKIFNVTGSPGCVTSESLKDFSTIYSNTLLNVTLQLTCSKAASNEVLEVISDSFVTPVKCGTTKVILDSWEQPLILTFPTGTDANLISRVTYNFPFAAAYCRKLNSRATDRDTTGSFLLPLFINPLEVPFAQRSLQQVSCNYELAYRPGYSILLKISHNLGYDDLDLYCHAKTTDRQISPHIVLTANQRDTDFPDTWMERQFEMCHGYSVGSLGTKSEMLIDGHLSINLLAMSNRPSGDNGTAAVYVSSLFRFLNRTLSQQLRFLITYEYVPSCPELTCRTNGGSETSCSTDRMSDMKLEATLMTGTMAPKCKWSIPANPEMRSALARQSNSWLLRLEVANFATTCPCHDCEPDESQELIAISQQTADEDSMSERIVICGEYINSSKVVYMAVGAGQPDIQIAYNSIESRATVRVSFVDCQNGGGLQCMMALLQREQAALQQGATGAASHGGLIFAIILLTAVLIGCLLYMNRQKLMEGGIRIQDSLRTRRLNGGDDTLQLTRETAQPL